LHGWQLMKGVPMFSFVRRPQVFSVLLLAAAGCSQGGIEPERTKAPTKAPTKATEGESAPQSAVEKIDAVRADAEALLVDEAVRHGRRLSFSPCEDAPELECGQLSVPVDYARPRGARLELATVRAAATGPDRKGVLFVNPGGPGASGVDFVIQALSLFTALREHFDIISFDPRGTARSAPVDCEVSLPDPPANNTLDALAAFNDELGRRYAAACSDQFGPLASQVGTNNVARDIDVLRSALGERKMNYLGFSYGTILGASYATLFPDRVRAMTLDANTPPAWFDDYLVELDVEGSSGAEAALQRIDQLCGASASCALRTAGVVATFDRVVARLNANPVPAPGGVINGFSATIVVFSAMYSEAFGWPAIPQVLARYDGGDYRGLPVISSEDGPTALVSSAFAIACNDFTSRRPGLDYLPRQSAANAAAPRFSGINFGIAPALCSAWPRPPVTPLRNLRTRDSIVLIGNDFDPATPMTWSRNMAAALGSKAQLVRYQGGGHTIYGSGSACIDTAIESYFVELTAPAAGLTCAADALSFGSSARAASSPTMAEVVQRVAPKPPTLPRLRQATQKAR
jgi:pimeloyl-ACP methyl ester carboxylesterase